MLPPTTPIRLVLVDDHKMFRAGVRTELDTSLPVVGEAGDVESAVAVIKAERPDVVLLDVHLPGGDGRGGTDVIFGCAGTTTEAGVPVRFLALSVSDAAEDVISVIRAGARGYVTKTIGGPELADSALLHPCEQLRDAAQAAMVGRIVGVLFEKPGRKPGQMVGKSDYLHSVFVEAPEAKVGDLVRVRIIASAANSLEGRLAA